MTVTSGRTAMRTLAVASTIFVVGLMLGLRVRDGVDELPAGEVREMARMALGAEPLVRQLNGPFDPITLAISVAQVEHRSGACDMVSEVLDAVERRRADYVVTLDVHTLFAIPYRSWDVTCEGRRAMLLP